MSTIQNTPAYKKMNALTTGALKTKAKKATGEGLDLINAILAERGEGPKTETDAATAQEDFATEGTTEATTETATEQDPELVAELAELKEKRETLVAAKKTNEVKKVDKRIADIEEELNKPAAKNADKPAKEPKAKKEPKIKVPKKTAETAVTSSKDKAVQARIDNLVNLIGKDLEAELMDLKMEGIDVEFIVFLSKGDEVTFAAANNSPLKGQTLKGLVVGVSDLDASGRKYCRVRVEGQKASFQKAMMAVQRIALPVPEVPKADAKADKADAKADKVADKTAPKADAKANKAAEKK